MMGTGLRWDDLLPHHRKYVYIGLILAFLFIVYRGYCYMQYPPQISIEYNDTGMMFIQKEEYANALNRFNEAIKYAPRYYEAYTNKAMALNKLERHKEALEAAEIALKIMPNYELAINAKKYAQSQLNN